MISDLAVTQIPKTSKCGKFYTLFWAMISVIDLLLSYNCLRMLLVRHGLVAHLDTLPT